MRTVLPRRRQVANTLAWVTEDGTVVRIEADRPLAEVLEIARSMR